MDTKGSGMGTGLKRLAIFTVLATHITLAQLAGVFATDDAVRLKKTLLPTTVVSNGSTSIKYVDSLINAYSRWNSGWDGTRITIKGARNEVVAFQVFPYCTGSSATGVSVSLDSLTKTGATTIKNQYSAATYAADLYDYRGKYIEWFVEHYMNITDRTTYSYTWWGSARPGGTWNGISGTYDSVWIASSLFSGKIPEQLIQAEATSATYTNGYGGMPVPIPANENHGFWCDITIPKTASAGDYNGTVRIKETIGGVPNITTYTVPIRLHVYDWTMSDTNHLTSDGLMSATQINTKHSLSSGSAASNAMLKRYVTSTYRHRINAHIPTDTTTFRKVWASMYNGTWLNADSCKYGGWGINGRPNSYLIGGYTEPSNVPGSPTETGWNAFGGSYLGHHARTDYAATATTRLDSVKWRLGLAYVKNDVVYIADTTISGSNVNNYPYWYWCISNHTASADKKPKSGASWTTYWKRLYERSDVVSFVYDPDTLRHKYKLWSAENYWYDWFNTHSPSTRYAFYLAEEPGIQNANTDTSAFSDIRWKARVLRTNPSGKILQLRGATEFKSPQSVYLNPLLDVIATVNLQNTYGAFPEDSVNTAIARGQDVELYGGTRPGGGTEVIDAPAIDHRIKPWQMWNYGITSHHMDDMTFWQPTENYWAVDRHLNGTAVTYGDGRIIYAGQDSDFPSDSRGIAGPIVTIRMKNWRRGSQDYEVLYEANRRGIDVTPYVTAVTPKQYDQLVSNRPVPPLPRGWAQKGPEFNNNVWSLESKIEAGLPVPSGNIVADTDTLPIGGGTVTISWESFNTSSATLTMAGTQISTNTSGDTAVSIVETTDFVFTVTNSTGSVAYTQTVVVLGTPGGSGTFDVTPNALLRGGGLAYIAWDIHYADSVKLVRSGGDTVSVSASSSRIDTLASKGWKRWYLILYDNNGPTVYSDSLVVFPYTKFLPFRRRE